MKKLILLTVLMLISIFSFGQNSDYPRLEVDSLGNQVVVMTIEQAQILDNKSDLLSLFENINIDVEYYDSICLKVISDKDSIIAIQNLEMNTLKSLSNNKDKQIDNLQSQILDYIEKSKLYESSLQNKDLQINEYDKKNRKMKRRMIIGGSTGGAIILGLLFLLLI